MIKEWLDEYKPKNTSEAEQALREIIQEIALAGAEESDIWSADYFSHLVKNIKTTTS